MRAFSRAGMSMALAAVVGLGSAGAGRAETKLINGMDLLPLAHAFAMLTGTVTQPGSMSPGSGALTMTVGVMPAGEDGEVQALVTNADTTPAAASAAPVALDPGLDTAVGNWGLSGRGATGHGSLGGRGHAAAAAHRPAAAARRSGANNMMGRGGLGGGRGHGGGGGHLGGVPSSGGGSHVPSGNKGGH